MTQYIPLIELKNIITMRGKACVLDLPEFSLKQGETVGLVGPNGSGKTTFLLTASTLLDRHKGDILFSGKKIESRAERLMFRRRCAFVFQEPLLFNGTVFENVSAGLSIRGISSHKKKSIADETLERFKIEHLRSRYAKNLSAGEAKRVSLARAFATQPDLIFLDEPFSSLDAKSRESLISDFSGMRRETGTSAIIATHNEEEALSLTDRIAVLESGRIIDIGETEKIFQNPPNEFMASLTGMETVLRGKIISKNGSSAVVSVGGKEIEAVSDMQTGSEVAICIRPEDVALTIGEGNRNSSVRNSFQATIISITKRGLFCRVKLECGFPLTSFITNGSMEKLELAPGKQLFASFKASAVHLIRKG